jgi:hypothetical protein
MWHWVVQNKDWLFSGAAFAVLGGLVWLAKKLVKSMRPGAPPAPPSSSVSNVLTGQPININVSPNISPVISPTVLPIQPTSESHEETIRPGVQVRPDIKALDFKAMSAPDRAGSKNCFVISFRNDGLGDATNVLAHIEYAGTSGQRMLVDYGRWIETEYPVPRRLVEQVDWERMGGMQPRPGSCEKIVCHSERSEESAFIFLKTNNCRFFASLRMTGIGDFFTRSCHPYPARAHKEPDFRPPR